MVDYQGESSLNTKTAKLVCCATWENGRVAAVRPDDIDESREEGGALAGVAQLSGASSRAPEDLSLISRVRAHD